VLYLDASAIVKLVRREPETEALVEEVRRDPQVVSSALAWTEVVRAARRARTSAARAIAVLEGIAMVPIDDGILRGAAELAPTTLRTLDAIHLATALSLLGDLDAVIAYDDRLLAATRRKGLEAFSPGA
jgi:predicted nucleic acid-binding protein